MDNLWAANTPERFWSCLVDIPAAVWQRASASAIGELELDVPCQDVADALYLTLGEGQFGPDHWTLSRSRRLYYRLKPLIPRPARVALRRLVQARPAAEPGSAPVQGELGWPIEDRYVRFLWAIMRAVMLELGVDELPFRPFWPEGQRFALVLTHDIETAEGQAFVPQVAALETELGFRSSFNFVPERYRLDEALIAALRRDGFEVGVHGLNHDGRLFESKAEFDRRARLINGHVQRLGAVGFRSPSTLRNPAWMQALAIDYDLSFFDTDPYEPLPGGVMTLWPFEIGRFVELPYTLAQDHTLSVVLGERTPQVWLDKLHFIKAHCGMALLNTHPDYLREGTTWEIYAAFLRTVQGQPYWHALPRDVACWWRQRSTPDGVGSDPALPPVAEGKLVLRKGRVQIQL